MEDFANLSGGWGSFESPEVYHDPLRGKGETKYGKALIKEGLIGIYGSKEEYDKHWDKDGNHKPYTKNDPRIRTAAQILADRTDEEILAQHRLNNPKKRLFLNPSSDRITRYARGFVPNFSAAMELNNSYSKSGTRVVNLRGIGLANTEETLGHHPRFTQPFVNPPEGSREGMLHKMRSISRTGVNPYSIPNTPLASQGSIPEIDTSGAQSSLGALTNEFDNLKTVLARGGFIPDGSGSGTSTVTNNMSVYSNGGVTGGAVNDPELADQMTRVINTLQRVAPEQWKRENVPTRKI
jgi:hypothetical protein